MLALAAPSPLLATCPPPSPRSLPERPLQNVRWWGGARRRSLWGLSRRWGLCHRTRRVLPLLPFSLPFRPAVSLNFQRRAPIGRTRARPRPTLEGSEALTRSQWRGDLRPAPVTVPRSVRLSGWPSVAPPPISLAGSGTRPDEMARTPFALLIGRRSTVHIGPYSLLVKILPNAPPLHSGPIGRTFSQEFVFGCWFQFNPAH